MEYGSSRWRLEERGPRLALVGPNVVAVSDRQFSTGVLQVFSADGAARVAEPVGAWAIDGEHVVAAPRAAPTTLRWYSLPGLEVIREVDLGSSVVEVVAERGTVAVATASGVSILGGPSASVEGPTTLAIGPSGGVAVGTATGRVVLLAASGATVQLTGGRASVNSLAFRADGAWIAAGCGKAALSWPSAGGKPVRLARGKHAAIVCAFAGERVVVHDPMVRLLAVGPSGDVAWELPQYGAALVRGDVALAARFASLREVDLATGQVTRALEAPNIHVDAVAWSGGDEVYASLSTTRRLRIGSLARGDWDGEAREGHGAAVASVHFADDRIATGGRDTRACVWVRGRPEPVFSQVAPSGYGNDHAGAVFLDGDTLWVGMGPRVHRFRVSDGALEATAELRADVLVLQPAGGVLLAVAEATRGKYGELVLLDPVTLERRHDERLDRVYTRASATAGTVRLSSSLGWALFDVASRRWTGEGQRASVDHARQSWIGPDGLLVQVSNRPEASGGPFSGWLWSYDAEGRAVVDQLRIPELFGSGDLDPGGSRLATPHPDGRVRVWDPRTGGCRAEIEVGFVPFSLRWFPDGEALLVWSVAGALCEVSPRA